MKNVFDIKKEKNLNFILPLNDVLYENRISWNDVLVVIYLYYEDTISDYMQYIKNIPKEANILFVTTSNRNQTLIQNQMHLLNKKYSIVLKGNRGRDISGLLVAARSEILKCKYVCFVHDKKAKSETTKEDTDIFIKCLWENTLGSEAYIHNILSVFERNLELGVLLPPESISNYFSFFFKNTWDKDFQLMQSLVQRLKLNCNLDSSKKPLSLGTVFWARVDALRKLFEEKWTYDDFEDEPLSYDGTFSHAIERCFAYVAQDAGYDTGIVMNDQFAGGRMDYLQEIMTKAFDWLKYTQNINNIHQLKTAKEICTNIKESHVDLSYIYIYGAGAYARFCKQILDYAGINLRAFIVSSMEGNVNEIDGIKVYSFSEVVIKDTSGIIIAAKEDKAEEIKSFINQRIPYFSNIFYFN